MREYIHQSHTLHILALSMLARVRISVQIRISTHKCACALIKENVEYAHF